MTDRSEERLNLPLLLFIANRAVETKVIDAVHAAGFTDTTAAQGRIFSRIGPEGTRLTELAEAAQVTKQTAGYLVDQLETAGYVERVPDPVDARARLVRITPRGFEMVQVTLPVLAEVEAEWAAHVGRRSLEQMHDTLSRLREITDPYFGPT